MPSAVNTQPTLPVIFDVPGLASRTGPSFTCHTGNVYFVQSSLNAASDSNTGTTPASPFKTLNKAFSACTANNGDIIVVMPGHVENVASAAALTAATGTADGVTVYFCGSQSDRATINFLTSTAAQFTITANNVTLVGPRFTNNIDALVAGVSVSGSDCTIVNAEYFDNAGLASLIQLLTTTAANRLTISGWTYYESTTGSAKTEAIRINGGDHHSLTNLNIKGSFSTANINNVTTATTNFYGAGWNLANPLTTATGVPLQTYVSTSTFVSPDVSPCGTLGGAEQSVSKTLALPQGTTGNVFTIIGGPIQVLSITGRITTVIGAVANATKLTWVPTVGGSTTDLCATTDLNAAAAGDLISLSTSFATAMALTTAGILIGTGTTVPINFVCAPGVIRVSCVGSDGGTGRVQWTIRYKPLAPGALVV